MKVNKLGMGSEAVYVNVHARVKKKKKWYRQCLTWNCLLDAILFTLGLSFICAVEFGYIPIAKIGFYCNDAAISHQYKGDTIGVKELLAIIFIGPILIIQLVERLRHDGRISSRKMWLWYRELSVSCLCFGLFAEILKILAGGHRPHFLYTCVPDAALNCSIGEYITDYNCLNTHDGSRRDLADAILSFPSIHAGFSVMVSLFCAIYIHKRFKTRIEGVLLKPILSALVLSVGFLVSISRMVDHRHHWWDVVAGITLSVPFVAHTIIFSCDSFTDTTETCETNNIYKCCECRRTEPAQNENVPPNDIDIITELK